MTTTLSHPKYRTDIDGLRAVAVGSVLGFHAFPYLVRGGYIGVDVFFVISGYLITTIIENNLERDRFSYLEFYSRRIKRIFPALIVVLIFTGIFGWIYLLPDELKQLGRHTAAGAGFLSNIVLRGEAGYFDNAAETKPLLHLWSLAIEEQFYIFWPLLLGLASRSKIRSVYIILFLAVTSFAANIALVKTDPITAFYIPYTRFWELMAGGALAHFHLHRPYPSSTWRAPKSIAGILLISVSIVILDKYSAFPGWWALMPCAGAYLLIDAGPGTWVNRYVLGNRIMVWIGKISYPLYLWHWPLLSFAYIKYPDGPSRALRISLLATSVLLAWLTYRFIESPIRFGRAIQPVRTAIPVALCACMVGLGLAGYWTFENDGFVKRFGAMGAYLDYFENTRPQLRYGTHAKMRQILREDCNFYDTDKWQDGHATNTPRDRIDPSCYTPKPASIAKVFIWGDSHAQHLNFGLANTLPANITLLQVATSACHADIVSTDSSDPPYCRKSNEFAMEIIRKERPDVVLIAQRDAHNIAKWRSITAALKAAGVRSVVMLGPIPQWRPELYKLVATRYWAETPARLLDGLDGRAREIDRRIHKQLRPDDSFIYVDLFDFLCDTDGCMTRVGADRRDDLITFDYGHLSPAGSMYVARNLLTPMVLRLISNRSETQATEDGIPRPLWSRTVSTPG